MSGAEWTFNGQILGDGFYLLKNGELFRLDQKIKWPIAKTVNVITGETHYPTNADRIRSMTDEELAEFMRPWDSGCPRWKENPLPCSDWDNCGECWLKWLKKEGEE